MSFSGTPLGQDRRRDHSSFLGKPTSNSSVPPASYAYGAPAFGSRSPPKPASPSRRAPEDEGEDDLALARFARIKQRESFQDHHRPGAPKVITSPPKPDKWSVKDTSVNIATAFTQAANGDMSTAYNQNNTWASTSRVSNPVPRSTSVEYEATAPQAINRRLAPPPDRLGRGSNPARKPPSKSASLRHVPDSEGEDDQPSTNGRGKSPFEQGLTYAKQALSTAAYYVRQRSREPEDLSGEQLPVNGIESSYDYAAEEQAFQAQKKNASAIHKRGRISVDNKAYKPSRSDDEESEYSDDGKGKRRKRKLRKGPAGGPLSTLPVVSADKAKKRRSKKSKGSKGDILGPDEEETESEDNTQAESQSQSTQLRASIPRSNPPQSRALPSRNSQEPSYNDADESMLSADQGLHSIPEVEEDLLPVEPIVRQASQQRRANSRARSRTPGPAVPPSPAFSIGGLLGKIVHVVIRLGLWLSSGVLSLLTMSTFLFGQVFGTTFDIILRRPAGWARGAGPLLKYLVPGLVLLSAWFILQSVPLGSYIPSLSFPSRTPVYQHPDVPPANIAELAERLLKIENVLSGLARDTEKTKEKTEDGIQGYSELLGRLSTLEGRLTSETKKVRDAEAKTRDTVTKSINGVKQEVEVLQSQIVAQQKQQQSKEQRPISGDISDEEARARLKALEERVGGVEGGIKEALEVSKKAVANAPAAGSGAAWWNKLASGAGSKTGLQIRSQDGQDVTALISHLVDSAVSFASKDTIAKPDFALHSNGAMVVPTLTSPTLEAYPDGVGAWVMGFFTANLYRVGRAPITALHHEQTSGHCWPFEGSEGQLAVKLAALVYIEEVSIDHVSKQTAMGHDLRSAPRQMEVWGMIEGKDNVERVNTWKANRAARKEAGDVDVDPYDAVVYPKTLPTSPEYIRLANFTYDIHATNNVQTFAIDPEIRALGIDFGIVVLRVLNNWGRDVTCLYRFRVHGERFGELPAPWSEETEQVPSS